MTRIDVDDVKAWVETTKLDPQDLNLIHLDQLETEVLARIGTVYNTSGWVDKPSTPRLIQVIIAKMYACWLYRKAYSENQSEGNAYAEMLAANAEMLIAGLIDGTIELPEVPGDSSQVASFYPTDYSSSLMPTREDPSLGPAKFSLGKVF